MKTSFLITFILASLSLRADSQEESVTVEAPYALEGNRLLEKNRGRWHHFEEEMKWFLVYSDPLAGKKHHSARLSFKTYRLVHKFHLRDLFPKRMECTLSRSS